MRLVRWLFLVLTACAVLRAQGPSGNPFAGSENPTGGATIFRSQCASCHGLDGTGSAAGSDLTTGTFKHATSDEALYRVITKGVPGTAMTGFALNGPQVWQLVNFLRSLNIARTAQKAPGDAVRGAQLFETQGCTRCHTVSGKGGFVGPDLSEIGGRRSLAQLQRALLDPNSDVASDYWSLRARTRGGETVTGIRLNEDTDTFQMREGSGRLRTLWKAELAEYEIIRTSPMPPFEGRLQRTELDDLIAYLASLRPAPQGPGPTR